MDDTNKSLSLDMSEPTIFLMVGKPKSGKSNAIKYLILKNSLDNHKGSAKFEFGLCMSGTSYNKHYDFLPKKYVINGYNEEVLQNYVANLEQKIEKEGIKLPPNFLILDDLIGLMTNNNNFLVNLFSLHRHLNMTIFLAVQYLKVGASTTLREITTHAILFNSKSFNTINGLFEAYGQLFDNVKDFKQLFLRITKEKHTGMLYISSIEDIENNYLIFKSPNVDDWDYQLDY
jgi:hypothetical protein